MNDIQDKSEQSLGRAKRDMVAFGIAASAILMFVGTGGSVLPQIARSWMGIGSGPDMLLVNALLLNIALIIFGWRRYRELVGEIEERRRAEAKARELAETDPLTGCLNRRSIAVAVDRLMASEAKYGRDVAFLMIDLDSFKQVNDLHGHATGDKVLTVTAERIAGLLPPNGLIARLGGDEFACIVPGAEPGSDKINLFVERLIQTIAAPFKIDNGVVQITVSVGIASNDAHSSSNGGPVDATALMHKADIAMYHAKKQGKNRYFWFEPAMEDELRFHHQLEQGIRHGIRNGEFVPYYEQQIDLESGELTGFEMLARWDSAEFGKVGPSVFIPIAEELGLIAELSEMLIDQALRDASEWDSHLTLSVNISPLQLRDPWFSQKLLKLLTQHNFPPQRLDIEITESCLHENIEIVRTMIASLRNQGVKVSLDDFGTGYSSLAQLRNLPFDRIKIDRSFVTELREQGAGAKIIDAIVKLGYGLKMPVVAEGIENNEILEKLKNFRELQGQGYFYGKPEDADTVKARLASLGLLASTDAGGAAAGDTGEASKAAKHAG